MAKCELLLWLGSWNGHTNSPVNISWSSVKVKVLGVFLGLVIWRRKIGGCISSWSKMHLIPGGSALCLTMAGLLSSTPWPFPIGGMWPL